MHENLLTLVSTWNIGNQVSTLYFNYEEVSAEKVETEFFRSHNSALCIFFFFPHMVTKLYSNVMENRQHTGSILAHESSYETLETNMVSFLQTERQNTESLHSVPPQFHYRNPCGLNLICPLGWRGWYSLLYFFFL